eukprot:scaffold705_cov119-Isochrysis_galbana.AAC.2
MCGRTPEPGTIRACCVRCSCAVQSCAFSCASPATLVQWATAWLEERGGCARANLRTPTLKYSNSPSSPIPLRPSPALLPAIMTAST